MLKTLLTGAFLLLTLMACATVAPTPARDVARAASLAAAPRRDCVSDTATRIPVKADECVGFGQTDTQNDLPRTRQREPGPALRMLHPPLTVARRRGSNP